MVERKGFELILQRRAEVGERLEPQIGELEPRIGEL